MLAEIFEQYGASASCLTCDVIHHCTYALFEFLLALAIHLRIKAQQFSVYALTRPGYDGGAAFRDVSYHSLALQVHKCFVQLVAVYEILVSHIF